MTAGGEGGSKPTANKLDLAGVVVLAAPLVSTLGLFKATGAIGRIQRDDPWGLLAAVVALLVAGALLAIANYLNGEGETGGARRAVPWLYGIGTLFALCGFAVAIALVFLNADEQPRPRIAASLNANESKLTAVISASNLKTDDRLALKVDLATLKSGKTIDDKYPFAKNGSLPLQRAYVGPDTDGDVKQEISLPIPRGGRYTDIVLKAFTGERNSSCSELPGGSAEAGTACMFIGLDPKRSGAGH